MDYTLLDYLGATLIEHTGEALKWVIILGFGWLALSISKLNS